MTLEDPDALRISKHTQTETTPGYSSHTPSSPSTGTLSLSLSLSLSVEFICNNCMARSLYQTLIRTSQPGIIVPKSPPSPHASRFVSLRTQSSQSENFQDFDSDQREALAVQKIEDAIHRIIVKRSAPDWLPFVPGSSYWVPPQRRTYGIADLVDKLANSLTEEEVMSLTTARGWPSSAFFVTDASPDPADIETASRNPSQSEDKDG